MLNRSEFSDARRRQLSSLMDGDLPDGEAARACILWRQDMATRQDWYAYHLIGDVLRSDELAAPPARDEGFLRALRLRLADEPVPFAPAALPAALAAPLPQVANGAAVATPAHQAAGRGRVWLLAPVAVAAGFMAVARVMVVTRMVAPHPAGTLLAAAGSASTATPAAASAALVRDAQLDRYLSAHRSLANGAMPGTEHRVHIVFEGQ